MTTTPRSRIHTLKTWPEHFSALVAGTKRCEIRYNDRDFRVGDCLVLQEFIPKTSTFTKEMLSMRVLHVTDFEQKDGYVVMSLEPWTQPPVAPDDTPPPFDQAEAEALVTALDDVKAGRIRTLDEIRAGAGKTVAPDDTPPDRFVSYAEVIQFTLERAAKIADQMAGAPWGGEHDSITPRHLAEQIAAAIRQAGTHELAAKHHHPFRGQRGEMGGGACCDCGNSFTNTCHDPILVDKPPVAPDDTPTRLHEIDLTLGSYLRQQRSDPRIFLGGPAMAYVKDVPWLRAEVSRLREKLRLIEEHEY